METARKPENEKERLQALRSLNLLDTLPEQEFDQFTFLVSQICDTPIAMISLLDENRQWFKSQLVAADSETHRDIAFGAHAILSDEVLVVPDCSKDKRFAGNPLVTGSPHLQFYAGAPIKSPDGFAIGTLCVADTKPRTLSAEQIEALKILSSLVTNQLKLRSEVIDIKKSETKLKFKNNAFEMIFEGVVLQDQTGHIIDFNSASLSLLNLTEDQLFGKTSADPTWGAIKENGADFPGHEHPAMVCLRTGKPQKNIVMGITNSTVQTRWLKISSVPLFYSTGDKPSHVVSSFIDNTEEVNLNLSLQNKAVELRFILDGLPNMVSLWGTDEININANRAHCEYFGKDLTEIIGHTLQKFLGDELYARNQPFVKRVLAGERVSFERTIPHTDGSKREVIANYIPNFENNLLVSFIVAIVDITEIRKLERNQASLQAQLVESTRLKSLGEMAAGVAHEINNPLTIIKGKANLLIRKVNQQMPDMKMVTQYLESIEDTVDRIAEIVKSLRLYSREATNDAYETANLSEIISTTLDLCNERFRKANVEVRLNAEPELPIYCIPAQISQVVMNLLSNAFDAVSNLQIKWIEIKGLKVDGTVQLHITDAGFGIPKDVSEKMMNPFFTTKEIGKGTGLGLSISDGIAQLHGGTLKYSETSPHTSFIVSLPQLI